MRKIAVIMCCLFTMVCAENSKLRYGMDEYFLLANGDKEIERSDRAVKDYIDVFTPKDSEIALNKVATLADGNNLFIGISLKYKVNDLVNMHKKDSGLIMLDDTAFAQDGLPVVSFFYKKNNHYFNVYSYRSSSLKSAVLLTVEGTDSLKVSKYLHDEKYFYDKVEYK